MSQINSNNAVQKPSPTGTKRSLVVGVNGSRFLPVLSPLKYAQSDAEGINWLLHRKECGFIPFQQALSGNAATSHLVEQAVYNLLNQCQPEDLLLFYFIGHSYATSTNKGDKIYLVTDDFDPDQVRRQPTTHLSLEWIRETFLENKALGNVIVFLDCCSAGDALAPFAPADQVLRSMEAFLSHMQQLEQLDKTPSTRMWAIITSTEANTPAYEEIDHRGEGHTRMTGLIQRALEGKEQEALDLNGDLTLHSLHNYLQTRMADLGPKQNPIMEGTLARRWVLAHYPALNQVRTRLDDFVPQHTSTPVKPLFDENSCETATAADLDMKQVRDLLQRDLVHLQDDYHVDFDEQQQIEALGLLHEGHPSYGALLCFGFYPSRQVSGAYTRCIDWREDTKRRSPSGRLDDDKEYRRGSLLQQFVQARDFLVEHLGDQVSQGNEPVQGKLYSRVLEEALANALIHREYVTEPNHTPRSEPVMVEILGDRIEINSPGGPPAHIDIAVLQKASEQHPHSHPRNPQIMRIFYLAGYVDRIGTGIARMQRWMQEAGLPLPKIGLDEQTQTFSIVLPRPGTLTAGEEPVVSETNDNEEATNQNIQVLSVRVKSENSLAPQNFNGNGAGTTPGGSRLPPRRTLIFLPIMLIVVLGLVIGTYIVYPLWHSSALPSIPAASTTIEIASDFPTSGEDTVIGLPVQNGVQMAIDEANNNQSLPGYTFKLTSYNDVGIDNRHDPQKGASNIRKAIADNLVAGIIGPYNSIVALAELPITNQNSIAQISPSTTYPCLTKDTSDYSKCAGPNNIKAQMRPTGQFTYFRLCTTDDLEGKVSADYFFTVQHYQKVLLLKDDSDPYSYSLAEAFQQEWTQLQGQVVPLGLPENASSVQDYQNALQAVASVQPDLIYFAGNDPNGTYVLQALSDIPPLKTVTFAAAGGIVDSGFLQAAAQLHPSALVYANLPIQDPAHSGIPVGRDFAINYTASGYSNYRPYTASAYDATRMLIQAIKTVLQKKKVSTPHGTQDQVGAKQFRQAILQELTHLTYKGATGTHSFDANGDTTNHTISFYQLDLSKPQADWTWLQQSTTTPS